VLALAGRLDAAGLHTDAINELSRAARLGDPVAKGRIGARILIGDRAPFLPAQGARLIGEAAREGAGEAAALAAVLAGGGIYRRSSWPEALDLLERSAELGFPRARGELAALTDDAALAAAGRVAATAEEGTATEAGLWRRLRRSIDPGGLVAAPAGRTLHEEPLIRAFEDFASPAMCDWLIWRSRGRLTRAQVYNATAQREEVNEMRSNTTANFTLLDTDVVQIVLQARMAAAARVLQAQMEAPAVLHYEVGEEITEHYDFVDPQTPNYAQQIARDGQRIITFLVYLNDDYEGGETDFPRLGVSHKGERGEGLFFTNALASGEPDVRSVHAGRPPTVGEKWIVSQFVRNRRAAPGTLT
jgi:hypothetical protein